MGTRCYIGMERSDKAIDAIYVHWDGYPSNILDKLTHHYSTPEDIEKLLSLGDLSSLGSKLRPSQESRHSLDNPEDDVCVSYFFDRNEPWEDVKPKKYINRADFKTVKEDYLYLFTFDEQKWIVLD